MPIEEKYKDSVKKAMKITGAVGLPGIFIPGLDSTTVGVAWANMIRELAKESGHEIDKGVIAKLVGAALAAVAAYQTGSKILTWIASPLLLAFPVAGIPIAAGVNGALNALFTYRLGLSVSKQLSRTDFTAKDFAGLTFSVGRQLVHLPSHSEIAEVRYVLTS